MSKCSYWEKIKNDPEKAEAYRARKRKNDKKAKENPEYRERRRTILKKSKQKIRSTEEGRLKQNKQINERYNIRMQDPDYAKKIRTKKREYKKRKLHEDVMFRIKENLRARLNSFIKKTSDLLRINNFNTYIGCKPSELRIHLESKFTEGMTWDNYGKWEIDHIIPLASAKTKEDMYKLCHYTNLQPLWGEDNRKKGKRITSPVT